MLQTDFRKTSTVRLPGGGEAVLRPFRGWEEDWVSSLPAGLSEPEFITALLARSVRFIDGERAGPDRIRNLTPGDRDFLVLQVGRVTFGPSIGLVLTCPGVDCRARMDATFDIQEVPIESRPVRASYPLQLPDGREIEFRLPRGEDQETAAGWSGITHDEKRARFLARCLPAGTEALGDRAGQALAKAIEAVAPSASLEFAAICPECGQEFSQRLEPARWIVSELRRQFPQFEREVHLLSLHYHWPLRDVLAMPRERRLRWVKMLVSEFERASASSASHK